MCLLLSRKVDRVHNGGLRLYTGIYWKKSWQSFFSTFIWAIKLNLVWKHSHVSFFGHQIMVSLTPGDLHLLFYE